MVPAEVPLKVTVLVPCDAPKLVPVMVTDVPTWPEIGFRFEMLGTGGVTEKLTLLLGTPPTATTTGPLVAPVGTCAVILVEDQFAGAIVPAEVPLKVTVLVPCDAPKLVPLIVTEVRTA